MQRNHFSFSKENETHVGLGSPLVLLVLGHRTSVFKYLKPQVLFKLEKLNLMTIFILILMAWSTVFLCC